MKYVHEISHEDDIASANELTFGLEKICSSNIESFIHYYAFENISEDCEEDADFDLESDDGTEHNFLNSD